MILAAIPAFDEEITVGSLVSRASKYVDKVIVVDDGSLDETADLAHLAGAFVTRHDRNMGYGAAIKTCFQTARKNNADILVIFDADGQHDPDEIPIVLAPILSGKADVVIGSRFIFNNQVKMPIYRRLGIQTLNLFMQMLGFGILDSQSGFRAYSRKAIKIIDPKERAMSASSEIILIAHKNGLRVVEVPIKCSYDIPGSTQNPILHGLSVLLYLLKLVFSKKLARG